MRRYLTAMLLLCFLAHSADAQTDLFKQRRLEAVGGIGTSHFFGDIGGYSKDENVLGFKDIILSQTRFNIEGALRYRILYNLNAKLSLTFGQFHAIDETGSNETRGMEATTSFFEPALTGEFYFIKSKTTYLSMKGRAQKFTKFMQMLDIYAFTGIGGLSYHVKVNDVLAAKGMPTGGFTAVIPAGFGATLVLPDYNLGIEIGGRYSFSDYLDGYTSQFSKSNDVYYLLTFTFTYKIPTSRDGVPLFLSKRRF